MFAQMSSSGLTVRKKRAHAIAVGRLSWRDQGPQAEGTIEVTLFHWRRGDLGCAFFWLAALAAAGKPSNTVVMEL